MKRNFFVFIILIFATAVYCEDATPEKTTYEATSYRAEAKRVAGKLVCPCGCGKMLVDSGRAKEELARIENLFSQGKAENEIVEMYVSEYGEWILATPPARGMNIMIWILPFLGAVVGFVFLWIAIRHLTKEKGAIHEAEQELSDAAVDEAEEELRRFKF